MYGMAVCRTQPLWNLGGGPVTVKTANLPAGPIDAMLGAMG